MFEGEVEEHDAQAALAVAAGLRAIADTAERQLLQVAAHYAELHPEPDGWDGTILPGTERALVCGGEGCPEVAEFAPVEFGAALGMSSAAATSLIEDALALRHRHPRIWARIIAGEIPAWRARKVAQATARLSRAAAALVDHRVANLVETVTPGRLARIVRAATMDADPELAQQEADACAQERGVWVGQSNLHGTKTVVMKSAAGDAIRFDAATDHLADVLAQLGDTDTKDQRRAKAVGWLADPQAALALWAAARCTDPSGGCGGGGRHTLYVHLTDLTLATGTGVVRVEDHEDDLGALLASQLTELLGHDKVVVKPVINLNKRLSVDAYEIPQRIREHVRLQHPVCQFPWCNRPASVRTDLDHTVPYDDTGPPGQTHTDNLVPLCRLHHRVKTHGRWVYRRLSDGTYLWTGPHGQLFRVDHTGPAHHRCPRGGPGRGGSRRRPAGCRLAVRSRSRCRGEDSAELVEGVE